MSDFSYISIAIIIIGILGFPYGFKLFCKAYVKGKKIQDSLMIIFTKIKCKLIKRKCIIKLQAVKEYQYIRIKIWINKYYRKQISISNKIGEFETANELKDMLKEINKLEREKFIEFTDKVISALSKML